MDHQQTDREHFLGVLWVFIALVTYTAPGRQAGSPLSHDGERQSPEIPLPLALKCGTEMSRRGDRLKFRHT